MPLLALSLLEIFSDVLRCDVLPLSYAPILNFNNFSAAASAREEKSADDWQQTAIIACLVLFCTIQSGAAIQTSVYACISKVWCVESAFDGGCACDLVSTLTSDACIHAMHSMYMCTHTLTLTLSHTHSLTETLTHAHKRVHTHMYKQADTGKR